MFFCVSILYIFFILFFILYIFILHSYAWRQASEASKREVIMIIIISLTSGHPMVSDPPIRRWFRN